MTAAELSDLLLEAALVVYAGATLALVTEILLAGRQLPAGRTADRELVGAGAGAGAGASAGAGAGVGRSAARRSDGSAANESLVEPVETERAARWRGRGAQAGRIGLSLMTLAAVFHVGAVVARGVAAGRAPWGNMFEFAVVGSLVAAVVFLTLMRRYDVRYLGVWVGTFVLVILGLAVTVLYTEATTLLPALRSTWLVIHVFAAIVSTGLLTVGAMLSTLYLVKSRARPAGKVGGYLARVPEPSVLDRLAFRVHAVAFPVYTFAVLIAGPIWAQYAWGRYWGWDPKETWAFITWVVYAAYLHARVTAGWRGRQASVVALVGYATLLFNFVGVNLLFSGMHSYAGL